VPGKSGPIPAPAGRPVAVEPEAPARPPVNRRTPVGGMRYDPASALAGAIDDADAVPPPAETNRSEVKRSPDYQRIKSENKELRKLLEEMKQLLQEASDNEQRFIAKEKEYQAALSQKDAQIQELSAHLGTIEEQIA